MGADGQHSHHEYGIVTLHLLRDDATGAWFAERIEMNLDNMRNQITFRQPEPLAGAFTSPFAEALIHYLPQNGDFSVSTNSHNLIEIPGLVLGGMRIIAQRNVNGLQRVAVRFRNVIGEFQAVLSIKYRSEGQTLTTLEKGATDALLSLLIPCLDLAHVELDTFADADLPFKVALRLQTLTQKKEDLAFFTHMLRRYVENTPQMLAVDYLSQLPAHQEDPAIKLVANS
ncbi:hypothetical protein [Thioclava sp. GXIMD4216]|uniref:hypothetical protein n=1 Tax=unclassified Thioclava TaxID=2621713 RepID=UPI0030D22AEC